MQESSKVGWCIIDDYEEYADDDDEDDDCYLQYNKRSKLDLSFYTITTASMKSYFLLVNITFFLSSCIIDCRGSHLFYRKTKFCKYFW